MDIVNKVLKLSGVLGIFTLCCLGFSGLKLIKAKSSYISVNGLADSVIKSDEATLGLSFKIEGNKLSDIKTNLSNIGSEVLSFLHKYGFTDDEIVSSTDEITDRIADRYNRYNSSNIEKPENRYSLERTIIVKTNKVDAARQLDSHLGDLYEKDICISISAKYASSNFEKIRLALLNDAVNDAKVRAQKIASAAGVTLNSIQSIATGRFMILDADTMARDWSNGEDSFMKRYRVVISASFDKK